MVAQPVADFLTPEFVKTAGQTLSSTGFLSDEHDFTPYRETMNKHIEVIEHALNEAGYPVTLRSGFVNHQSAGYSYYIYNQAILVAIKLLKKRSLSG